MNDFTTLAPLDIIALGLFFISWIGYAIYYDHHSKTKHSLLTVMDDFRLSWMREMLKRENRMMDETLIGNLLRSISFFASTSILLILGLITLLKYRNEASQILVTLPLATPTTPFLWEVKTFLLTIIFIYAFFKYTWSLRQYNYACIMVGAAPPAKERLDIHEAYAQKGAKLVSNAARHFNMGLRAYYFGFSAMSWFIHPIAFIIATIWVVIVVYRREFYSKTLENLGAPNLFED
jgi:uncharacterized membrane protein